MRLFGSNGQIIGRFLAGLACAAALSLGASETARAADHRISPQKATFECAAIKPGDTLTIPSGARGPLRIRNCKGTQQNPIIVRNDPGGPGPAILRRTSGSGGFIFNCNSCVGVRIDGSYKWRGAPAGKTYGIQVTIAGGGAPTVYFKIDGLSRFVTIRNVEVDGQWPARARSGIGIDVNEHSTSRSRNPGTWLEGILIEDNYVHNIATSGMYIGPNYNQGDFPLRDIEIRNNRVENTGTNGILTKSMWAGDNRIHHNTVRSSGNETGITVLSGTARIYNNWIEKTGQHGIKAYTHGGPRLSEGKGPFEAHIWNNVIVDAGRIGRTLSASFGITVGAQNGLEKPIPFIYNNTIVNPLRRGINVTSNVGAGYVRDNIVAGSGGNPVIKVPGIVKLINNRVGPISQMGFVDPARKNYRLNIRSPARNQGSNVFPDTDFDNVPRPKEGSADQGAFEGNN